MRILLYAILFLASINQMQAFKSESESKPFVLVNEFYVAFNKTVSLIPSIKGNYGFGASIYRFTELSPRFDFKCGFQFSRTSQTQDHYYLGRFMPHQGPVKYLINSLSIPILFRAYLDKTKFFFLLKAEDI